MRGNIACPLDRTCQVFGNNEIFADINRKYLEKLDSTFAFQPNIGNVE